MGVEHWCRDADGTANRLREKPAQVHFVHWKFHTDGLGIEPGAVR